MTEFLKSLNVCLFVLFPYQLLARWFVVNLTYLFNSGQPLHAVGCALTGDKMLKPCVSRIFWHFVRFGMRLFGLGAIPVLRVEKLGLQNSVVCSVGET